MPEPSLDTLDRLEAYYGPPPVARASVFESVRRHLILALLPVVVLGAAAAAFALHRAPNYTAEARVSVGRIDLTQPGAITGFATATQALASAYSRAIDARAVVAPVSRRYGLPEATVLRQLSATPVPLAPLIRVTGIAASRGGAVRLANGGADALTKYLNDTNSAGNPESARILRRYSDAQLTVARASLAVDAARRSLRDNGDTPARRRAVASADSDLETAKLQAQTISTAYAQSQQGRSLLELVSVLSRATDAKSDRRTKLEIYVFGALLCGALLGAALATARENRLRGT
jgi:capsular polysaccharide biosynthesis protein